MLIVHIHYNLSNHCKISLQNEITVTNAESKLFNWIVRNLTFILKIGFFLFVDQNNNDLVLLLPINSLLIIEIMEKICLFPTLLFLVSPQIFASFLPALYNLLLLCLTIQL